VIYIALYNALRVPLKRSNTERM